MPEVRLIDANALDKKIAEEAVFKIKQADRDSARAEARGLIKAREYIKDAPTIITPLLACDGCFRQSIEGACRPNCKRRAPDYYETELELGKER